MASIRATIIRSTSKEVSKKNMRQCCHLLYLGNALSEEEANAINLKNNHHVFPGPEAASPLQTVPEITRWTGESETKTKWVKTEEEDDDNIPPFETASNTSP